MVMNTIIQVKNLFFPEVVHKRLNSLLEKLAKKHQQLVQITATIQKDERNWAKVSLLVRKPGKDFVVEGTHPQLMAAITDAYQRLDQLLVKSREKMRDVTRNSRTKVKHQQLGLS